MKSWFALICLLGLSVSVLGEQIRYDNYKLLRFTPTNEDELKLLVQLQESNFGVIFWQEPSRVGRPVDVMFPPHLQGDTFEFLRKRLVSTVMSDNVQTLINNEARGLLQNGKALNWESYGTLDDINEYLASVAASNSFAEVVTIGKSFENRDLNVLKISKSSGSDRPAIWLDGGIHAREWISPAVVTYVINELLTSNDTEVTQIAEDFDLYVMPVMNPDGYVYTQTDRMWRKTRATTNSPLGCRGADANRNWDYRFDTGGSSPQPCSDTYHGGSGFSQPETKAASDFYNTIGNQTKMFLSVHSYSQYILLPYGYSAERYPDYQEWMRIGQAAARAIAQPFGTEFTVGNIVDLLYVSSGGSVDWIKGIHDTSVVLAFELRDTGRYGFVLPPDQIKPSGVEFLEGFKVLVRELRTRLDMP
ncbi:Zinc carboxypeptidase A 1 [Orchesella cincta]|uniref:Zinc carboxypeptidase A 1 n=1 Tax=Orchesella cincta TaxID=48709 RepID=A0A1D2MNH2_ORCCI|nr:Zinc carboxypeptidase A 1 [Orchesella cincta]